jgi:hypothetical protein
MLRVSGVVAVHIQVSYTMKAYIGYLTDAQDTVCTGFVPGLFRFE